MPIDLNTATPAEKTAILGALGLNLNELSTRTAAENLSNKTLVSPAFSGICSGQLELSQQLPNTIHSAVTRSTIRRELMMQESAVQRFTTQRTWNVRGGTNASQIANSGDNVWLDTTDGRAFLNTSNGPTTGLGLDHTSWARKDFGTCHLNFSSGGSLDWNFPFSISFRFNHSEQNAGSTSEYWLGISNNWSGGLPCGRGVGIVNDINGYRLWFQDGTAAVTSTAGNSLLTTVGAHGFTVGDRVRFTAMKSGITNLAAQTTYFVVEAAASNTFKVSTTSGGVAIVPSAALVGASTQVAKSPTYSPILSGFSVGLQNNHTVLISSNGLGTASLYYGTAGNTIPSNTPLATLPVASTGGGSAMMAMSCTFKGSMASVTGNTAMAVINASFAPFAA